LGMSVLEPLVNRKGGAGTGLAPEVTLRTPLVFTGTGRSERRQQRVFAIVPFAMPVKANRKAFLPRQGFNRPANIITASPGCEFDGTVEGLGHSQLELSLRTGYRAVPGRLDAHYGSRKWTAVVADGTSDYPFRTHSVRRCLEPRMRHNCSQHENAQNGDVFRTSRNRTSPRSAAGAWMQRNFDYFFFTAFRSGHPPPGLGAILCGTARAQSGRSLI
jgi:hypothetical protein